MSYTETPNLKLKKDDGNEKIANWRPHSNGNMDILDEAVQNLVEVCANAKSLLGQLGLDESGNPLVNAASARNTLGAATSGGASKSLYAAEQSIATNASNISKNTTNISKNTTNISKNATDIQTLRDSVSHLEPLSIPGSDNKGIPLGGTMILWVDPQQKELGIDRLIDGSWIRIATFHGQ